MVHPDVEERMNELFRGLHSASIHRYENAIVIININTETIIAAAFGTAYTIRTGSMLDLANNAGAKTINKWSNGTTLDLKTFGTDWVMGAWHKNETVWMNSVSD